MGTGGRSRFEPLRESSVLKLFAAHQLLDAREIFERLLSDLSNANSANHNGGRERELPEFSVHRWLAGIYNHMSTIALPILSEAQRDETEDRCVG